MTITNEQVATEVMGWRHDKERGTTLWWFRGDCSMSETADATTSLPDFLSDHNAAMMVVEKMREKGWRWSSNDTSDGRVCFQFLIAHSETEHMAYSRSLCHAICEAALKALGKI
jgi:hypothetical protein